MATAKAVEVQGATADQAFRRCKPLLDRLRDDIKKAAEIVAKEYEALPKLEKSAFADRIKGEYGWSQDRLGRFARIGRDFPKKKELISSVSRTAKIDDLDTKHMELISGVDDSLLKKAASAGMFDKPVTTREIETLRKTGRIPEDKPKAKPTTDLQKVRALMEDAEGHIRRASLSVGKIVSIMYDADITDAKGKEATALIQAFEKLCTEMASANPKTSKRAFAILRGEA